MAHSPSAEILCDHGEDFRNESHGVVVQFANWNDQSFGTFDNTDVKEFTCPSEGFGSDWVLVLDDASRNFITPGSSVAR